MPTSPDFSHSSTTPPQEAALARPQNRKYRNASKARTVPPIERNGPVLRRLKGLVEQAHVALIRRRNKDPKDPRRARSQHGRPYPWICHNLEKIAEVPCGFSRAVNRRPCRPATGRKPQGVDRGRARFIFYISSVLICRPAAASSQTQESVFEAPSGLLAATGPTLAMSKRSC